MTEVIAALAALDLFTIFDGQSVLAVVAPMLPHALVKGGDCTLDTIVCNEGELAAGGQVVAIPTVPDYSTTDIIAVVLGAGGGG